MLRLIPLLAVCLCLPAADWPCYRGEKQDGIVVETGLRLEWSTEGLPKLWSASIGDGGRGTHGGVAICAGKVYIPGRLGEQDVLFCLEAQSGRELWRCAWDAPGKGPGGFGSGSRATPTVADGHVYALGAFGHLVCMESKTGKKVWIRNLIEDFQGTAPKFGVSAAPIVEGDFVISEPGGKEALVVALDRLTGREVWRSGGGMASYAPPQIVTLAGVRQVLCYPASGLLALNPADGKELWRYRYEDLKNIASPIVDGDLIYVSNNNNGFSALTVKYLSGKWLVQKTWNNVKDKAHTSAPVAACGLLCFYEWSDAGGYLKGLDAQDGALRWSVAFKGKQNGMLLLLDSNHLLVNFDDGELRLFQVSSEAVSEKYCFKAVGKGSFAPISISDGRLYARDSSSLTCFDVKAK